MKRLGELDNIQLLYEVKADALQPIDELIDDAGVEKESKEEIIKDTKFRFRALLERWHLMFISNYSVGLCIYCTVREKVIQVCKNPIAEGNF